MSWKSVIRKTRNIAGDVTHYTRRIANPFSVATDPLINSVVPGYSSTAEGLMNPISKTSAAILNPLNALNPVAQAEAVYEALNPATKSKRVVPNRDSYAKSASYSASQAAKNKAEAEKREAMQATKELAKAASESAAKAAKAEAEARKKKAEEEAKKAEQTAAVQQANQANATGDASTAAAQAEQIYNTMDTAALINALAAARGAGMAEYYLPEQEVKSDFFKYLALGGALLLGFYAIKKMK